jgi:hypothetical protein
VWLKPHGDIRASGLIFLKILVLMDVRAVNLGEQVFNEVGQPLLA